MSAITPTQIVEWFRAKAAEFTAVADSLEQTFSEGKPSPRAPSQAAAPFQSVQTLGMIDPERERQIVEWLKMELGGSSGRAAIFAEKLNLTREEIKAVIDRHPDIFDVGEKGWVKLKQKEIAQ